MRILHLSDFHLEKESRDDSINHIITPLLTTVESYHRDIAFDLILFTGDMVNMGGKGYENISIAFHDFQELVIKPLLIKTDLDNSRFFFVPGNHDINRSRDSKNIEAGLKGNLTSTELVNQHIETPEGNERIKEFKAFENEFYSDKNIGTITDFHSSFRANINGRTVGIACLNSSWRCFDSKTDKNQILIGERQFTEANEYLKDCEIKIALAHHHFDWLKEFDAEVALAFLKTNFHMFFCGHTHKLAASYYQDPDGQLFTFCAPGTLSSAIRNPERKFENGFTVIDYNLDEAKVSATFLKGEYLKGKFVLNVGIGNGGIWETRIPVGDEVLRILKEQDLISQIRSDSLPRVNAHLITHSTDTTAPKEIDELFVLPNISIKNEYNTDKGDSLIDDINELLLRKNNCILFGTKESGKTVLLDKILLDTLKSNKTTHLLPALIDFNDITDDVTKNIRDFWGQSTVETKAIIRDYNMLLLIEHFV